MVLETLFTDKFGTPPESIEKIAGAGSSRQYYRLYGNDTSVIGTIGSDIAENKSFIYLSNHLISKGIPVPQILKVTSDASAYLQSDAGTVSLFDYISSARKSGVYSEQEFNMLRYVISALPDFQFKGAQDFNFSKCYPVESLDSCNIMWDLNYFKYCFLKTSEIPFNETLLEEDFKHICKNLLSDEVIYNSVPTLIYRDFQSRNVMIAPDGAFTFIDFQGARRGPIFYDLASFLWQARANFSEEIRNNLIGVYLDSVNKYIHVDAEWFRNRLTAFVFFRQLQTLGAYGFRGLIEKKPHFLQSIAPALDNICNFLSQNPLFISKYPYLAELLIKLKEKFPLTKSHRKSSLVITVGSFSFKKGLPEDPSGNGGGYIFDCRGMENPGRYEQYRPLTGRDTQVIEFLEERGEVQKFLNNISALITPHVENYISRDFSNLSIWFGCTGGRHRSVYCAEHFSDYLTNRFPEITVKLIHRETPRSPHQQ